MHSPIHKFFLQIFTEHLLSARYYSPGGMGTVWGTMVMPALKMLLFPRLSAASLSETRAFRRRLTTMSLNSSVCQGVYMHASVPPPSSEVADTPLLPGMLSLVSVNSSGGVRWSVFWKCELGVNLWIWLTLDPNLKTADGINQAWGSLFWSRRVGYVLGQMGTLPLSDTFKLGA